MLGCVVEGSFIELGEAHTTRAIAEFEQVILQCAALEVLKLPIVSSMPSTKRVMELKSCDSTSLATKGLRLDDSSWSIDPCRS